MHFSFILQDFESKVKQTKMDAETKIINLESKVNGNKANADSKISGLESKVNSNKGNADSKIKSLESTVKSNKAKADTKISDLDKKVNSNKNDANSKISSLTTQHRGKIDALWKQVENPVIFSARAKYRNSKEGSYIGFSDAIVSYGGGLNLGEGIFKAPRTGAYSFSFTALTHSKKSRTAIDVYKNTARFTTISSTASNNHYNIAASWMMNLKKNEYVRLKMTSNDLVTNSLEHVIWNGELKRAT